MLVSICSILIFQGIFEWNVSQYVSALKYQLSIKFCWNFAIPLAIMAHFCILSHYVTKSLSFIFKATKSLLSNQLFFLIKGMTELWFVDSVLLIHVIYQLRREKTPNKSMALDGGKIRVGKFILSHDVMFSSKKLCPSHNTWYFGTNFL